MKRGVRAKGKTMDLAAQKRSLRKEILTAREALSPEDIAEKSRRICDRVRALAEFQTAETVLSYMPMRGEVDVSLLFADCFADGKTLLLPKTKDKEMSFYPHAEGAGFLTGPFSVLEPVSTEAMDPLCGVMLLPGVVFGRDGNRIGYGGGFYDRYLEVRPMLLTIGVAYDLQVVPEILHEDHDVPLNLLVTESAIYRF